MAASTGAGLIIDTDIVVHTSAIGVAYLADLKRAIDEVSMSKNISQSRGRCCYVKKSTKFCSLQRCPYCDNVNLSFCLVPNSIMGKSNKTHTQ